MPRPSHRRVKENEIHPYEKARLMRMMRNNARLQELGLFTLSTLRTSVNANLSLEKTKQSKNKCSDREDSGSEYDPKDNESSEGEEIDNNSVDEEEPLFGDQSLTSSCTSKASKTSKKASTKTAENYSKMAPGGRGHSKRVTSLSTIEQSTIVSTRSQKVRQSALATIAEEQSLSTPNDVDMSQQREELHTNSPVTDWAYREETHQPIDVEQATNVEPSSMHDVERTGDGAAQNEEHTQLGNEDTAPNTEKQRRSNTMGKLLDRMTRTMGRKLPINIAEGNRRPHKPVQAAKLASEGGIAVRNSVPILTHWKEYKKEENANVLDKFMGTLSGRLAMDTDDQPIKDACANLLQDGVRQARYRLKRKYFDGVAANEVRTTSPVNHITNEQWRELVRKWSDPKNKEISEKNKQNRAKVKYHQTTGSRSYIAHCYSIREKYKDQEPTAVDIFKECHNSNKKGFSEPVREAIVNMEAMMEVHVEDGETPKSSAEIVSKVLTQTSKNSQFLKNVGLASVSTKSSTVRELQHNLEVARQGSAALQHTVDTQQQELDILKKKTEAAEEAMNKQQQEFEEFKKQQEENNALLHRLLSSSQVNPTH